MLFQSLGLAAATVAEGVDVLQRSWPTVAAPAHFAPPVEAREDDDALVVVFDVRGWARDELDLEIEERTVRVYGLVSVGDTAPARRARRTFVLHAGIRVATTEATFEEGTLTVRVIKQPRGPSKAIVLHRK